MNGRRHQHQLVAAFVESESPRDRYRDADVDALVVEPYPARIRGLDDYRPVGAQSLYMGIAAHRDGLGADTVVGPGAVEVVRTLIAYAKTKKKCLVGWLVCVLAL